MKLFIVYNVITLWALFLDGLYLTSLGVPWGSPAMNIFAVYLCIWLGSLVIMMIQRTFAGKDSEWVPWENDPGSKKATFLMFVLGGFSVFACANIIPSILIRTGLFTRTSLFVPEPSILAAATSPSIFPFISAAVLLDIFFNAAVVGLTEQMAQTSSMNAFGLLLPRGKYAWLKYVLGMAVVAGISCAHGYLAYVGPYLWIRIIAAFAAFTVMFAFQMKTGSLLLVGEIHSAYNIAEILIPLLISTI